MQAIYVCSPYRGDIRKNTKYAMSAVEKLWTQAKFQ